MTRLLPNSSVGPAENEAVRRQVVYLLLAVGLTVSYIFLRGASWRGTVQLHTLMEVVATMLALMVGFMALVRYYSNKSNEFLIIGTAFIGTAFLDGYHAVVTSTWFAPYLPSDLPSLIPWSWIASRFYLSVFLALNWYVWFKQERARSDQLLNERAIYLGAALFTIFCFLFFAFFPLPRAYYPELIFHRPEEFVPALLLFVALIGHLAKGHWRHNQFEHWLVLSLIVGFVGQTVFMSFSGHLFDMEFDVAHLLKKVSYICVLTGLFISMYGIYRYAETSRARLTAVIDHAADGIITTDSKGALLSLNPAAKSMFGYPGGEAVGHKIDMIVPYLSKDIFLGYMKEYDKVGQSQTVGHTQEAEGKRKGGGIFPLTVGISKISGSGMDSFVATIRDITDLKNRENALLLQKYKLEQSNAELEQFATIASHDLQEPLRKVQAFGDRLQSKFGDQLGEQGTDYLFRMQNAAQRMEILVKELLNFSRVTSRGKKFTQTDLSKVVAQVLSDIETQIEESKATLQIGKLPIVEADEAQMHRLFLNMIGNSLKYRRDDEPLKITIESKAVKRENSHLQTCEIKVSDNGIGFEAQYSERIFGIFQRLQGRDQFSGTGIGLAICKKIVERHSGSIKATGATGKGAVFTVTLPYKQ